MSASSPSNSPIPAARDYSTFQRDLIALIPQLRAFSRTLCQRRALAEDIAQDALAKAWHARGRFEPGTNLRAWLFTILRNEYYSHARRAWRESHLDEAHAESIAAPPNEQEWHMKLVDTMRALQRLPTTQRETLILVAAGDFSYEEVAKICNTPIGTTKSRVARARAALIKMMDGDKPLPPRLSASGKHATDDIHTAPLTFRPAIIRHAAYA